MPAKAAAAKGKAEPAAAAAAAAPAQAPPPEDDGPMIDPRAVAIASAWRLIDKEGTTFATASSVGTFFAALGIFPTPKELAEDLLPSLEPAGASERGGAVCDRGRRHPFPHPRRPPPPPRQPPAGDPARVTFSKAEARALAVLRARTAGAPSFEAPSARDVADAFRALDTAGTGAVMTDRLRSLIATEGKAGDLTEAEFENLLKLLPAEPRVEGEPDRVSYIPYAARAAQAIL
jgi:Ca2+-binding EF-hand superfamily protein